MVFFLVLLVLRRSTKVNSEEKLSEFCNVSLEIPSCENMDGFERRSQLALTE